MLYYHFKYIFAVLRHKWWVFKESCKLGIPIRGILHDFDKFMPSQYYPRVRAFKKYNTRPPDLKKQNWSPDHEDDEMKLCWLRHYHKNPHHWQWWVTFIDDGNIKVFPMTDCYRREMLADWIAVSRRPDRQDIIPWYQQNKDNIILHPETREWLEEKLDLTLPL